MLAIMYGAGKIGRAFVAREMKKAGYDVVFLDWDSRLVSRINGAGEYPVHDIYPDRESAEWVRGVAALDSETEEAARLIGECDLLATSVGANSLPLIARVLAKGVRLRMETGRKLDILICENKVGADHVIREELMGLLSPEEYAWMNENIGLVDACIGCTAPVPTAEQLMREPLGVYLEPCGDLPVDRAAFRGEIPGLPILVPYSPFDFYIKRKLYIHNMAHASLAYLGKQKGYTYVWQAAEDPGIMETVFSAMEESARALKKLYPDSPGDMADYLEELRVRFGNRRLGDTVRRVGADPARKLARDDRLVGAAEMCLSAGGNPEYAARAIRAAAEFYEEGDPSAGAVRGAYRDGGLEEVVRRFTQLPDGHPLLNVILRG